MSGAAVTRCSEDLRKIHKQAGASSHTYEPLMFPVFTFSPHTWTAAQGCSVPSSSCLNVPQGSAEWSVVALWRVVFGGGVWYIPTVAAPFAGLNIYMACFDPPHCFTVNMLSAKQVYGALHKSAKETDNTF